MMRIATPLARVAMTALFSTSPRRAAFDSAIGTASNKRNLQDILPPLPDTSRRLYLCNNGETDWNADHRIQGGGGGSHDLSLNAAGQYQAQLLAEVLSEMNIGIVASSHLSRSEETADCILAAATSCSDRNNNIMRILSPKLGEMRFGEFEGMKLLRNDKNARLLDHFLAYRNAMQLNPDIAFLNGGEFYQPSMSTCSHWFVPSFAFLSRQSACRSSGTLPHQPNFDFSTAERYYKAILGNILLPAGQ